MKAWRVHDVGEPAETFVLDDIDEPTAADLAGMSMDLAGCMRVPVSSTSPELPPETFTRWSACRVPSPS